MAVAVAFVIAALSTVVVFAYAESEYVFDPAPLAAMLLDAVTSMRMGDCRSVTTLVEAALQTDVPQSISYLHSKAWRALGELCSIIQRAVEAGNTSREDVYRYFRLLLEAQEVVARYADSIVGGIRDPAARLRYRKRFDNALPKLFERLDELGGLLSKGIQTGVKFEVLMPDYVEAGSVVEVILIFEGSPYVENISIILTSGGCVFSESFEVRRAVDNYTAELSIPGTESGCFSDLENQANLYVALQAVIDGRPAYGALSRSIKVQAFRPPISLNIPTRISPGENLKLVAESNADTPLRASVTVVNAASGEAYINETIVVEPGVNEYILNTSRLPVGTYRTILAVEPEGKYLPVTYSYGLVVLAKSVEFSCSAPVAVLAPPFSVRLSIELPGGAEGYIVEVLSSDERILFRGDMGPGVHVVEVPLSFILLGTDERLTVRVIPIGGGLAEGSAEVSVIVLNQASIAVVAVLALIASSVSAEGAVISLRRLSLMLEKSTSRIGIAKPSPQTLYRRLIRALSIYVDPPKPSETLREYCSRVTKVLGRLSEALPKFIHAYERYLYSKRKPSTEELVKAFRGVEREL